ncbi:MAG: hypothetical protein JO076_08080 [Verrucomicrobia bacterium]|nr:hypothetical protein [Verrucomicrobiota bacterium]
MSRSTLCICVLFTVISALRAEEQGEHIVVTGGVSMMEWEKYKAEPHDHWWLNFIRASRIRIEQLRQQYGPSAPITWLVYQRAYQRRQSQEHDNLFSVINSVRDKYGLKLIYFNSTDQLCAYLNNAPDRARQKIASFDYFGHSNRACFMFDYSNEIGSASKVWLHESELKQKLRRGIFTRHAQVQSWGCYTGESMSRMWYDATGAKMIGAEGKTQYMTNSLPILSTPGGKWTPGA